MSFANEQIARLESLLARIQRRVAEPRVPRAVAIADRSMVPADPTPPYTPVLSGLPAEPVLHAEPEPLAAAPKHVEPVVEAVVQPAPEPISGEFAVAEEMLELEELGPASEFDNDPVVEARHEPDALPIAAAPAPEAYFEPKHEEPKHEDVATLTPAVEDGRPDLAFVAERAPIAEVAEVAPAEAHEPELEAHEPELEAHDEREQPPESGRELVAAPHESQRIAVAAPATPAAPEELSLELHEHALETHDLETHELGEPEHPASSRRLATAAPVEPEPAEPSALGDVFEVPPKLQAPEPEAPELDLAEGSQLDDHEPPTQQFELDRSQHAIEAAPEPHLVEAGPPSEPVDLDRSEHAIAPAAEPHLVTAEPDEPPTLVLRAPVIEAPPIEAAPIEAAPIEAAPIEVPGPDVLRPQLVPADVAAYITAARAPRPETFGQLLDAALEL